MIDHLLNICTALFILSIPTLSFCGLGYLLYRALNFLLKTRKILQAFGVVLLLSVIAIYFIYSSIYIKDIYQMLVTTPKEIDLLNLKSFCLIAFWLMFFMELSVKSITEKSLMDASGKWSYPFFILFCLFILIGIIYTLTMMFTQLCYLNGQDNFRLDLIWYLMKGI